jgi:hypothetical protein
MPLAAREIELVTLYAEDGVRPIAVTPPTYDQGNQWPVLVALAANS